MIGPGRSPSLGTYRKRRSFVTSFDMISLRAGAGPRRYGSRKWWICRRSAARCSAGAQTHLVGSSIYLLLISAFFLTILSNLMICFLNSGILGRPVA